MRFMSPITQDAILTLDWMPKRRLPLSGCEDFRKANDYTIFVTNTDTNERVRNSAWTDFGYGYHKFENDQVKGMIEYKIMIYDFGIAKDHDFTVTLYT